MWVIYLEIPDREKEYLFRFQDLDKATKRLQELINLQKPDVMNNRTFLLGYENIQVFHFGGKE